MREDSICQLLENSCDMSDDDEEIELLVEEGQTPVFLHPGSDTVPRTKFVQRPMKAGATEFFEPKLEAGSEEDDESLSSQRDSFSLGAGCLPCTPKSQKKKINPPASSSSQLGSNWCCGVVANTVKKTTKKF